MILLVFYFIVKNSACKVKLPWSGCSHAFYFHQCTKNMKHHSSEILNSYFSIAEAKDSMGIGENN